MRKPNAIMAELPAKEATTGQPVIEQKTPKILPNERHEAQAHASPTIQPPFSLIQDRFPDQKTSETSATPDAKSGRREAIIDDAVSKFNEQLETRMSYLHLRDDEVQMYQQTKAILSRIASSKKPDSKLNMLALASSISYIRSVFDMNASALDTSSPKLPPTSINSEISPTPTDEPPSPGSSVVMTESEVQNSAAGSVAENESGAEKKSEVERESEMDKKSGAEKGPSVEAETAAELDTEPEQKSGNKAEQYDPRMVFRDTMLSHAQILGTDDLVSLLGYMEHIVGTMSLVLNDMTTVMQSLPTEEGG